MIAHTYIAKTREYLDYVERHINNVEKAWKLIQEKCSHIHPLTDDWLWSNIDYAIKHHDVSKLSPEEFVQYRRQFYPVDEMEKDRNKDAFKAAWRNHKARNHHHWETWANRKREDYPNQAACNLVEMLVDWTAMGFEMEDSAEEYYEKMKKTINLKPWGDNLLQQFFNALRD